MNRKRSSRMTPDAFVKDVMRTVVDDGVTLYRGILARPGEVTDPYWRRVLALHRSLPPRQRRVILEIMRQVQVDTLSEIFGILDGESALGGRIQEFELVHKRPRGARVRLNGDLQDLFLGRAEG